ncbi:hypothetical protein OL548_13850 [Lysinibacillus sp. MHQ-1]|nr:hypothetical protein OL548_13850 [Lysinibacillus sp. MHQ-1]
MNRQHMGIVFGGILLLVIAMGISRFAFYADPTVYATGCRIFFRSCWVF